MVSNTFHANIYKYFVKYKCNIPFSSPSPADVLRQLRFKSPHSFARSRNRMDHPSRRKISHRGCNLMQKKKEMADGARDDALHLSRRRLSLFPADFSSRSLRSASSFPSCSLGTGHTQMGPSILRSALLLQVLGPLSFARCGVTMPSHSWALLPVLLLLSLLLPVAAEWRMEKQRAGGASCYVECRIRGKLHSPPLPPLRPWSTYPPVAFIPPLHFPSAFPKSFDLSVGGREGGRGGYPRKPRSVISNLRYPEHFTITRFRFVARLITCAVSELFAKMNYLLEK